MPLYKPTLEKYPADIFFETGTYDGEGCLLALNLGFKEVHSIELDLGKFQGNLNRFKGKSNVHLYHGSSDTQMASILPHLTDGRSVTFWLDAHPPGNLTLENCPVKDELELIAEAMAAGLVVRAVMIDDMRLFSAEDREWLTAKMAELFPGAEIRRDNGIEDNDLLTAYYPPA